MLIFLVILAGFFYFRHGVYYSKTAGTTSVSFKIVKGDGVEEIGAKLEKEKLINNKYFFYYYIKTHNLTGKILPGEYQINFGMTIPDISEKLTTPQDLTARITFPEGLTLSKMADIVEEKGFNRTEFLGLVENAGNFKNEYSFLQDEKIKTLEGYLFPDTYFIAKDARPAVIVKKMLDNFESKITPEMLEAVRDKNKTLHETIILASLVEKEMAEESEAKLVAGVFANRLEQDMLLQSDAPLTYILGDSEDQHSGKDLELDSPYNTYKYKGLPPGPIASPGLSAILAAITPEKTEYSYFLTIKTGNSRKTIFSKTFEEHVANRKKYGL